MKYQPQNAGKNPNQALAQANCAVSALLGAIEEQLRPAFGANWGHVGDANEAARRLLEIYAFLAGKEDGAEFSLTTSTGETVTFTYEEE